jgi:hypothetical protein
MSEEFGKRFNIESKKLIRANKVKLPQNLALKLFYRKNKSTLL